VRSALTGLLATALAGCGHKTCAEGGECVDSNWDVIDLVIPWTGELLPSDDLGGLGLEVSTIEAASGMVSWDVLLTVTNLSEDADCVVLLYQADDMPDRSLLWEPDPAEDPPAEVDGFGELILADNLTRVWDGSEEEVTLSWESEETDWEGTALPPYLSLVTCAEPDLAVGLQERGWWYAGEAPTYTFNQLGTIARLW
jgi:hypothetical protein